jgi:hypothetical protein
VWYRSACFIKGTKIKSNCILTVLLVIFLRLITNCSAYELYVSTTADKKRESSTGGNSFGRRKGSVKDAEELCKRFKDTLSQANVKVHFVGAW